MFRFIIKNIQKYVITKYFEIVILMLKLLFFFKKVLVNYKGLKVLYIFIHYIDSKFL
jgi:hypothetical protein